MAARSTPLTSVHQDPVGLAQRLVRFDTSNPPGNERECALYIQGLLEDACVPCELLGTSPERPNLIARLPGDGRAAPLLLQGHLDVVPAAGHEWRQSPFQGEIIDGYLWGRGALDMKGGIAMMVSALLRLKAEGITPAGDVILALMPDEEAGGHAGARYLVEQHPERFQGVKYAIGEFGGYAYYLSRKRFYPIMVAEKQVCRLRATVRGASGHGSLMQPDSPVGAMGRFLQRVQERRLPVHVSRPAKLMFQAIAAELPWTSRAGLAALLNPALAPMVLKLLGARGRTFGPLLRNTVNATVVRSGEQVNVVPSVATAELDGRVLPGYGPDDLISEIRAFAGNEVEIELVDYDPGPEAPDMGLFQTLAGVLREQDEGALPVPMLMPAATDGRLFARLGIQTYGFLPMDLPEDFDFASTIHGINERVPVSSVEFGARAMFRLLQTFGSS